MSTTNQNDALFLDWLKTTQLSVLFYSSAILTPLGIFFNIISLAVFLRKKLRGTIMAFFNILFSISNILVLLILFTQFFFTSIKLDTTILSVSSCKTIHYLIRVLIHSSSWIQVAMTVDRMLIVAFHNKFKILKSKKALSILLLIILAIILSVNFSPLTQTLVYTNTTSANKTTTTVRCTSSIQLLLIRDFVSLFARSILPFILMFISNLILIRAVIQSKYKLKNNITTQQSNNKEVQVAFSIIAINCVYLVTNVPIAVVLILIDYFTYVINGKPIQLAILTFCQYVSVYLGALNYVLVLPMNIWFNKIFRLEFLRMLFAIKFFKAENLINNSYSNRKSTQI